MQVGIVGMGVVGNATAKGFEKAHKLFLYDKFKDCGSSPKEIAQNVEVVFLCVSTPMQKSGEVNLLAIFDSVQELDGYLPPEGDGTIIVIRSTAVSGSTDKFAQAFPRRKFAVNPEFLTQANANADFLSNQRIIIGAEDNAIFEKVKQVYVDAGFKCPIVKTNLKTAEMVKYTSNAFLACKTIFANEIYNICKVMGIEYEEVNKLLLFDERFGKSHWQVPGPDGDFGFGGACFPKDISALIYLCREYGYKPRLLEEVWRSNLKFRKSYDWEK